jgi:hypothetical protein
VAMWKCWRTVRASCRESPPIGQDAVSEGPYAAGQQAETSTYHLETLVWNSGGMVERQTRLTRQLFIPALLRPDKLLWNQFSRVPAIGT